MNFTYIYLIVHCWHYRRFVAAGSCATTASELAFTRAKIDQSFSNYSAWHQRSLLLLALTPIDTMLTALNNGSFYVFKTKTTVI